MKSSGDGGDKLSGVREWDRNKMGDERDGDKRQDRDRKMEREREVRIRERSGERKSPQVPSKSLEELFKKTSATPAIYWKPLSEKQIQQRIELRNKVGLYIFTQDFIIVHNFIIEANGSQDYERDARYERNPPEKQRLNSFTKVRLFVFISVFSN